MDGLEASRQIRSAGFTLPIVAVTGNALEEDQASFLQAGANVILTKPVSREALANALASFLGPNCQLQAPEGEGGGRPLTRASAGYSGGRVAGHCDADLDRTGR